MPTVRSNNIVPDLTNAPFDDYVRMMREREQQQADMIHYGIPEGVATFASAVAAQKKKEAEKKLPERCTCGAVMTNQTRHEVKRGVFVCDSCLLQAKRCALCNGLLEGNSKATVQPLNERICSHCEECDTQECDSCGLHYPSSEYGEYTPEEEVDDFEGDRTWTCFKCTGTPDCFPLFKKPNVTSTEYQSASKGNIMRSNRKFSFEIECMTAGDRTDRTIVQGLPKGTGIGHDGSIDGHGIEIQTAILQGASGEECVKTICTTLNNNFAEVNASCGLHTHLDCTEELLKAKHDTIAYGRIRDMMAFTLLIEDTILLFLPYGRRHNSYCRSVQEDLPLSRILKAKNMEELEKAWYHTPNEQSIAHAKERKGNDTRYAGYNYHSLFYAGHLEVRFHTGTLNYKKMLHWSYLNAAIMDFALNGKVDKAVFTNYAKTPAGKDRAEYLFSLIGLSQESRRYFLRRMDKFTIAANVEENLSCAA